MAFGVNNEIIVRVSYTNDFLQALSMVIVSSKSVDGIHFESYLQFGENIESIPESKDKEMQKHLELAICDRNNVCRRSSMVLLLHVRRMFGKGVAQALSKWFYLNINSWEWELISPKEKSK